MKINKDELSVLVIEEEAVDFYMDFISLVKRTMDNPNYLGDFTKEDVINILRHKGIILMYKYSNILCAACMMIPSSIKDIEKFKLDYDYKKVIKYGPQAVFEDFRGNGIQKYMIEQCDKLSKDYGYEVAITTVDSNNTYSIKNIEESGFKYIGNLDFSRGNRNIYQKFL